MSKRIWIIGAPGSGKTTLANNINKQCNYPVIHLDDMFWSENWGTVDRAVFQERVIERISNPCWVVDGDYSEVSEIIARQCDCLVLLKANDFLLIYRIIKRCIIGIITRKTICGNNKEELKRLFGKNGLIKYALNRNKYYQEYMRKYEAMVCTINSKKDLILVTREICGGDKCY